MRRSEPDAVAVREDSGVTSRAAAEADVAKLLSLLDRPPPTFDAQDTWTEETSALINSLFLQRVSHEDLAKIIAGIISFRTCGLTSHATQLAFIQTYCDTNGVGQELLHRMLFPRATEFESAAPSHFFGRFSAEERAAILTSLRETGYAVLPKLIPEHLLAQMRAAAQGMDYSLRGDEKFLGKVNTIDPDNPPACTVADAAETQVVANPLFNALFHDPQIISIMEEYIGAKIHPVAAQLRYTFPSSAASSDAAQQFHYDLDTLRWVKVFCYLNDIEEANGPHVYVEGSHKLGAKDPELLRRLYERVPDEEFADDRHGVVRTATGPAGTIIIGDTRCYHKGLHVKEGHRLIFFPFYAPSELGMHHGTA